MRKLRKICKGLWLLLSKPYLINKLIDDNEVWQQRIEKKYGKSIFPEIRFSDLNDKGEIKVKPFSFMEGGSLPTDLALLKVLAGKFENCKYFEIGTWRGESVANVAEIASECTTMNLSDKEMMEMGLHQDYINQHAMFSEGISNVVHLEENSLKFDFGSLVNKYDLIFIDGDHHYESILSDTKNVFKHLVHENSIVVWHDYAWQPSNIRHETMAAILDGVPEGKHDKLYGVRNTLCAVYYNAKVSAGNASSIAIIDEAFEVKINMK